MRLAIVEDDDRDAGALEGLLRQYFRQRGMEAQLKRYSSGEDFLCDWPQALELLFLDIRLPALNGMDMARLIRQSNEAVQIVFLTNDPSYSMQGYGVGAADYLLKPPSRAMLDYLMPRLLGRVENLRQSTLCIRNNEGLHLLPCRDILYVEFLNRRVFVHTKSLTVSEKNTLQALQARLPGDFFRCHNAFLVNLAAVKRVSGRELLLTEGSLIPVSKHRHRALMEALARYIRGVL